MRSTQNKIKRSEMHGIYKDKKEATQSACYTKTNQTRRDPKMHSSQSQNKKKGSEMNLSQRHVIH